MKAAPLARARRGRSVPLPVYLSRVECGFPSPADDFIEGVLDLNDLLITDEIATYFVRASGSSMTGVGIFDGDLLVVSRAKEAGSGDVVIAALGGDMTVKILEERGGTWWLVPASTEHESVEVDTELHVWGTVTYVIHQVGG